LRILGIETSCDETAAAVVDGEGHVLSDVVHTQVAIHAPYGGVVPELASRDHLRNARPVITSALDQAGVDVSGLTGIAVTCRPGLTGALLVRVQIAARVGGGEPWLVDHLLGQSVRLLAPGVAARAPDFPFVA
jgi:N6-L-threonylcarbamoyladenine synthase